MSKFLLIFFSVYGAMHLYAFFRARRGLSLKSTSSYLLLVFMLFMVSAPVLIRMAEREGMEAFPSLLAFVAYSWMGLLFFFVTFSLLADLCRLSLLVLSRALKRQCLPWTFSQKKVFCLTFGSALLVSLYSFYEAQNFSIERLIIETDRLPADVPPVRIVQISDLHIGLIIRGKRVRQLADRIKEEAPDILVATGDIIDGQSTPLDGLSNLFRDIKPRYGKYAVLGNHEYYVGLDRSLAFLKKAGFRLLRGEGVTAAKNFIIAGADDEAASLFDGDTAADGNKLLSSLPEEGFTLLLKHRPVIDEGSIGLFDLQLSGHTHNGQIFPFNFFVWLVFKDINGLYDLNGIYLHVSPGTGTWGPYMRLGSRNEITLLRLVPDQNT